MDEARSTRLKKASVKMRVSRLFADVVELQRKKISEVTYGCVGGSDSEVTEIIAKKILSAKII